MTTIETTTLRDGMAGQVVTADDPGYDEARAIYNAMIDRRPAVIARCRSVADVRAALEYGRRSGLAIAVRGGGHNGGGLGSVDEGVVIDLSPLKAVSVDPATGAVRVGGGCVWGEVDAATGPHNLAVPTGIISSTGVGGLTLGGGHGYLARRHGLTIDNLLSAEMVLADGSQVTASATENPDLFWAIRGGGGNFGVVTSITAKLHPVNNVVAGPMFWSLESAPELMRWYRDFILNAPEELGGFFAFLTVPPAPPFPEELQMQKVAAVIWCWAGDPEKADEVLAEARSQPGLLMDGVQPMPLPALQSAFDPVFPPGEQWYWRADFVEEIPDEAIEQHVEYAAQLPSWKSTMHLYPIDGAVHRVGADETPWGYRNANWGQVIVGVDPDAANAKAISDWAIAYHEAPHPFSAGGAYVNMMMDEGQERVKASYGANYDRLAKIKAEYDPGNIFHVNQNIRPAA